MKFRTKILGALAALFLVAGPAQAQTVQGGGNSALLVAIWDGSKSLVVDLMRVTPDGGSAASGSTFANTTASSTTFDLSSYITAAGLNLASSQFMVFAGDNTGTTLTGNGFGLLSTVGSGDPTGLDNFTVKNLAGLLTNFITAELNGTCAGAINCAAGSNAASNYWNNSDWFQSVTWNAAGSVGGAALNLYKWVNAAGTTSYSTLGSASLASNGTLSFATASAVPLPAAGWLLLSGLGGLGAAARRRRRAPAAA